MNNLDVIGNDKYSLMNVSKHVIGLYIVTTFKTENCEAAGLLFLFFIFLIYNIPFSYLAVLYKNEMSVCRKPSIILTAV